MNVEFCDEVTYQTVRCCQLSDDDLKQCKNLFDENYGTYDSESSFRPGQKIRFPISLYREYAENKDVYVALARYNGKIIGQAFYLRVLINKEYMSWVLQLVVDEQYRQRSIAKTLLHSIWGFSSNYAWGLATSNAITVKTLEKATYRKVNPSVMSQHGHKIHLIQEKVSFAKDKETLISDSTAIIHSEYPVDRNTIGKYLDAYREKATWVLGEIGLGDEWLAFTFRDQPATMTRKDFEELFQNSERIIVDAYSRMNLPKQNWNKGHGKEIPYILNHIHKIPDGGTVVDWGCGAGRHSHELARLGFKVIGVDYSARNIQIASSRKSDNETFYCEDCRSFKLKKPADIAICLYDVVGSSVNAKDNKSLIQNIRKNLKHGGYLVLSVMNRELTEFQARHKVRRLQNELDKLISLPSSNIMQSSGAIFDPKYYLYEETSGIVYRKEQFENDGNLSAEYVIRDKRYSKKEICRLLFLSGFRILSASYVRAGHWDVPLKSTNNGAKEILVIAQRIL